MAGKYWRIVNGKRVRTELGKKREYERWQSSTKAKKDRAARNSARRSAIKSGKVKIHDGTSIDHIDSNPRHNAPSNLRVISRSANAGRREDSRKRGSGRNRSKWGK